MSTRNNELKLLLGEEVSLRPKPIYLDDEPTPELVEKLIYNHLNYLPRYERLQNYYEGYNDIIYRKKKDISKPNNKLVSGYPSYIVDLMQGYFVGKPVVYTSAQEGFIEAIQDIFNYCDEQDENSELAKMAGIKGRAYEIVYIDKDSKLRFNEVDADNIIMIYDTAINPEPNFAIYFNPDAEKIKPIVYTKNEIIYYSETSKSLIEEKREDHYFKQVPIIEFLNNDEAIGDFERVITLIDAYDLANSDTANDFEEFTDAFLWLRNMLATDDDDLAKAKEDKVLLFDEDGEAGWLIKDINDTALENYKDRLNEDIHKFSKVLDISDEKFAGNVSGVALSYKLLALDQVISAKQRKFKRALQRRLELICSYLCIKDKKFDYRDIEITFTTNKPINEKEAVEMAKQMLGITSLSTALAKIPGVDDVNAELEKIENEKADYIDLDEADSSNLDLPKGMTAILDFISKLPEEDRDAGIDIIRAMREGKEQ